MLASRAVVSVRLSSASARRRPMKLEASAGRLPDRRLDLVTVIESYHSCWPPTPAGRVLNEYSVRVSADAGGRPPPPT